MPVNLKIPTNKKIWQGSREMEKVSLMFKIEQTTNSQKSKKNNKFY